MTILTLMSDVQICVLLCMSTFLQSWSNFNGSLRVLFCHSNFRVLLMVLCSYCNRRYHAYGNFRVFPKVPQLIATIVGLCYRRLTQLVRRNMDVYIKVLLNYHKNNMCWLTALSLNMQISYLPLKYSNRPITCKYTLHPTYQMLHFILWYTWLRLGPDP